MSKKKNKFIPELRFPEFKNEGEWEYVYGDELFEPISNKDHNSDLPILAVTQEQGAVPRDLINYHVSVTEKSIESYKVVEIGDFIISLRSFQGGIEYSNYLGLCSPAYIVLRKKEDVINDFYRHYFKSYPFIQDLNRNLEGIRDGKMISYKQFSEILIPKPKIKEQEEIASCLTSIDELVSASIEKLELLKDHKKGLIQNLFPQEGETTPKLSFTDDASWKEFSLPDMVYFQEGPGIMAEDFRNEGVPLVRLSGIGGNTVTLDGCNFLDPDMVRNKWEHFRLTTNDLVISTSATFGLTSIVSKAATGAIFYTGLIRFRPINKKLSIGFLKVFLGSPLFERQAKSAAVGGGIKHFGPSHLKQMKIALPSIDEQQKIASCISALDEIITEQAELIEQLKVHKKGLIQSLFPKTID